MKLGLWNALVMLAIVACPAAATTQDPLEVVGTVAAGLLSEFESDSSSVSGALATGSDDWKSYKGLPMVGTLLAVDDRFALTFSEYYSSDKRGKNSLYACFTTETEKAAVLLNHPAGEDEPAGGVAIEIVENRATARGEIDGWFLAAHVYYPDDMMGGAVRLIAHRGADSASIFKYTPIDGRMALQVVGARHPSGQKAIGGYLIVPVGAGRDKNSWFVAVSDVQKRRLPVTFKADE